MADHIPSTSSDHAKQNLVVAVEDGDQGANTSVCLLTRAAELGDTHLVTQLLAAGLPVDGGGETSHTPLYGVARHGHDQVVSQLVTAGASLEATTERGDTALHVAAQEGHQSCVETLLGAGADPNSLDNMGRSPLLRAALNNRLKVVQVLMGAPGTDRQAVSQNDSTALHMAAAGGCLEVVQLLVEAGLNPAARNIHGYIPLDNAKKEGRHLVEWWLRKSSCTDAAAETPTVAIVRRCWLRCDDEYENMLEWIRDGNTARLVANIPSHMDGHLQDTAGKTVLHWAAELGLTKVVKVLLEDCWVYAHVLTWAGETPADLALRAGHHHLHQYINNTVSKVDESPEPLYEDLLVVISHGDDVRGAGELLQKGAPLEPVGGYAISALCSAITSNRPRIVSLLVAAGAPLTKTSHGLNLLTQAWCSPDITPKVQVAITRVFFHVLQHERDTIKDLPELLAGVVKLTATLRGETPWLASWPRGTSASLTELMVQAARAKCTLTCSFLYLAGAQASMCTKSSVSPLHAALEAEHWRLAGQMVKDMEGCLYVPDSTGRLPTTILPQDHHRSLSQSIYEKERNQLQDLQEKIRNKTDKQQLQEVLEVQELLFATYWNQTTENGTSGASWRVLSIGSHALLVASRSGLQQLIYLLVKVGGLAVDDPVDPTSDTTALHQAASHGKSGCILLLLSLGAQPLLPDRYGQTPPHLAAMFGHKHAYELLEEFPIKHISYCRAGTNPENVHRHFSEYLEMYKKSKWASESRNEQIYNDQTEATKNLLHHIDLENLVTYTQQVTVDYTKGEALEVRDAVMKELQQIIEKVSDETYKGELRLLGSTEDHTRLYCPDEFDVNFVLEKLPGVKVNIIKQKTKDILASGHELKVELQTENSSLYGNNLITKFYERVSDCLIDFTLGNKQLSLVPPGMTRTQVGVALSLAWQGSEYPLLLIGVDLVPVLVVPWPKKIERPPLTPKTSNMVHLSNTDDGSWRCSFAAAEVEVLQQLDQQERQVFLTCKTLLSCLKAEPWMPRDVKNQFSWWDSRFWNIPTPAGFCLKNSFLKQVEKKRQKNIEWKEKEVMTLVVDVFRAMCLEMDSPSPGDQGLVPAKVKAYFGGDCERPKVGDGAPEIVDFLQKNLQKSLYPRDSP